MPFINSKISFKITTEQEEEVKSRLGQAISAVPGKSENWLMVGFEDDYKLYFKGQKFEKLAFVEVKIYGGPHPLAFDKMTEEISRIYDEVLGIPSDKIYITYEAISDWGWNGNNF